MSLYLVQHGKSYSKEIDPERKLTDEGKADVERIAQVAKEYGVIVKSIHHSGKKRAEETANILASPLSPVQGIMEISGLNPKDDVISISKSLSHNNNDMFVGHLPFMEKLTSYLITGDSEKLVFKFQNGGIVCLDSDETSGLWYIKWTLMPRID